MPDLLIEPERPIVQTLRYSTDIIRAHDGTEQRIASRLLPRWTMEFTVFLTEDADIRDLRGDLYQNMNADWRIPIWWEWDRVTSAVGSSDTAWPGDFLYSDLVAGDTVYILDPDESTTKIDTLASVSAGQVVTDSTAGASFAAGTRIFRLATCKIRNPTRWRRGRVYGAELSIVADEATPRSPGGQNVSVVTHDGLALLDPRPVAPSGIEEEFTAYPERVDFGGVFSQFSRIDPAFISAPREYLIPTREDRQSWGAFLDHVKGRREPFFCPTYRADLVLDSQPSVGASTITVADNGYNADWWATSSHKHLRLNTDAGEVYREVTGVADNGATLDLTLGTALPASTAGSTINEISFLEQVRLGSDEIRFEHHGHYSRVSISTVVVQQ